MSVIKITHRESGELIAEGQKGWGVFSFEGNYFFQKKEPKNRWF